MSNRPSNPDKALATRTRELEAVRAVTVEITQELDLPTLLALINRHAAELVGAASSIVRLWDEQAEVLIPVAWYGLRNWIGAEVRRLGESVSGAVAARREGLIVNDYQTSPYAMPAILTQTTITAVLAEPLLYRERLLGVLAVDRYAGDPPFSEEDAEILRLFAAQAAIAIENARLHEAVTRRAAQLASLTDLTQMVTAVLEPAALAQQILEAAQALIPGVVGRLWEAGEDALHLVASIGLQDPAGGDRFRFLRGEGMAGQAIATRQPVICADVSGDSRFASKAWAQAEGLASCIVLPLVHRDQALGVLGLYTRSPHVFAPDEVRQLGAFAAQAAIAMANARLYTAAQEELAARKRAEEVLLSRTRQLEVVREVSAEITQELDLDRLLTLLTRRVTKLLGVPTVAIRLWDEASGLLIPKGWTSEVSSAITRLPFRLGEGVAGAAAQRRMGLLVNDFRTSSYATPALLAAPHTAVLAEPLLYHDRLVGVLSADNGTTGRLFTPDDQALLRLFADQAAIAIENARLFTEATQSFQNLQKAQAALVQTEKLRALGQMAGGIAHDLNNKLMVILGQTELLRLTVAHPALEQGLAPLESAATASIAVVRQILEFGRQHANAPRSPIALAPVVEEALVLTQGQWKDVAERQGSPITVRTALADLPPVPGQAAELREALVQLIGNAVEAMPTGGRLTIAGRVPAPGWVELTVTDTGVGIPAEIQPDLFDPFFTTKGVQRTGLGLAVVYGTVQRHGGTISVASTPSQGTTFTLRLPAAVAVQTAAPPAPAPARAGVAPRRLLLIDDEPKVRGTLASLLRAAGHTVTEAASGPAGLALLGTMPVDCVLTDLGMPEMTGWEVVKAVNASWPHLPVLLLTGWGGQEADVPPGHRVARVLSKPIRREPLLAVIAEVTRGL